MGMDPSNDRSIGEGMGGRLIELTRFKHPCSIVSAPALEAEAETEAAETEQAAAEEQEAVPEAHSGSSQGGMWNEWPAEAEAEAGGGAAATTRIATMSSGDMGTAWRARAAAEELLKGVVLDMQVR